MHELVLVLSDLYVSQEAPDRELPAGVVLPGLQRATRFGTRAKTPDGWRPWLSRWLTGRESSAAPATVVAGATWASLGATAPLLQRVLPATVATANATMVAEAPSAPLAPIGSQARTAASTAAASHATTLAPTAAVSHELPDMPMAWMATPVHLLAGMTSIHLDRRSILRLDPSDQAALTADFQRVFHDSGFHLQPLEAGDFLMLGPQMTIAETSEPARFVGASMAEAQRADASIPALLRLGAELEMWLHDHAINEGRRRRGELPVTALWLWGGGPVPARGGIVGVAYPITPEDLARGDFGGTPVPAVGNVGAPHGDFGPSASDVGAAQSTTAHGTVHGDPVRPQFTDIAFGRDSYLQSISATRGAQLHPLPQQLADVFSYPHAQRAVLVIEIGVMLQSNPMWTFFDAVSHIDRSFIVPAIEALNQRQLKRLMILANDHQLLLRPGDRLKFWRRTPPGLAGLQ